MESTTSTQLPSPTRSSEYINKRFELDGYTGTILFHGPVPPSSSTSWFGVEWDDSSRGKHSGTHNNHHYFTTRVPNSGSFLRITDTLLQTRMKFARSFLEALVEKYVKDALVEDDMVTLGASAGKVEVETVGWGKIARKQARLERLMEVGLAGLRVGFVADGNASQAVDGVDNGVSPERQSGALGKICPAIVDLDLSRNLFSTWFDVAAICRDLRNLESLRLVHNRFTPLRTPITSLQSDLLRPAFQNLRALSLNSTLMEWRELILLEPFLPHLRELHFGFNRVTSIEIPEPSQDTDSGSTSPRQPFAMLELLNLENNSISSWSNVVQLRRLPNLQRLFLNDNQIASIDFKETDASTSSATTQSTTSMTIATESFFPSLRFINLNRNQINDWISVHNLNRFPVLTEIRLKFNPIIGSFANSSFSISTTTMEPTSAPAPAPSSSSSSEDLHLVLIARLARVTVLNGSTITQRDRTDAEMYYLNKCGALLQTTTSSSGMPKEQFLALHPRFDDLVSIYGAPAPPPPPSLTSTALKDRLLQLTLTDAGRTPPRKVKKRLPGTMNVRALKVVVGRLFGITGGGMVLKALCGEDKRSVVLDDELRDVAYYGLQSGDEVVVERT
ncbi:hypothetical protein HK102_012653 [Quaeritorhiza haematococci]|nr:hypothetical protein HK102_012653 [Quaeritorhiza haematococci]